MSFFTTSPNMLLTIPAVGLEPGPNFGYDINASLTLIDSHNHGPGQGVQITPAGLNINSTLSFNSNSATSLSLLSLTAANTPTSTIQALSSATSSSINELYYTDSNGTQTQITKNGAVNAIVSSITGLTYSAGVFIFNTISAGVGTTVPASIAINTATLSPATAGAYPTVGVTLNPPSGIATAYNLYLPNQPASTGVMLLTAAGVMSTTTGVAGTYLAGGSNPAFTAFVAPTSTVKSAGSGTYNLPAGCVGLKITCLGAGASGGTGNGASNAGGGGGGAGGTAIIWISSPSSSYAYSVGAGGNSVSGVNVTGNNGGSTSFGSTLCVATGGVGGLPTGGGYAGGSSGVGTQGAVLTQGGAAMSGYAIPGIGSVGGNGGGGQGQYGGGGGQGAMGAAGTGSIGGGGGGSYNGASGAGGTGLIVIEEFYS